MKDELLHRNVCEFRITKEDVVNLISTVKGLPDKDKVAQRILQALHVVFYDVKEPVNHSEFSATFFNFAKA
jgi:hypothetical protein